MAWKSNQLESRLTRRRWGALGRASWIAILAVAGLTEANTASAQLATRHYIPPLLAYSDSDIDIELSTPSGEPVAYRVFSKSGGLSSGGQSVAEISGTVARGAPRRHQFTRANNNSNSTGALGYTTSSSPSPLDDYGIIVEADAAVTVTVYQLRSNNRDIVTSKGSNAIGQEFYLWSAANTTPTTCVGVVLAADHR